ncbi:MAG: FixH family protein [Bdellovibrio sp.]|nr:FixH family protein [Bdellovibrio sp.]
MQLSKDLFIAIFSLSLIISSCGPMNKEVKDELIQTGSLGQASGPAKVTTNEKYYVSMILADENGVTLTRKPKDNEKLLLIIRSVHAQDLHPLASETKLSILYEMPSMPGMEVEEEATLQADGSYRVSILFSMGGIWKVTLTIKDGDKKDEYSFETEI